MSRGLTLTVTIAVALLVGRAHAAASPAAKCAAAKHKAAVKKIGNKLKCHEKADAAGVSVDYTCLATAETKFSSSIAKADAKGGCVVAGNEAAIEGAADTCVGNIVALTPVTCGESPYPQCGGECPSGMRCQAFISEDHPCGGLDPHCSTYCGCVDPAAACNGQACNQICSVATTCVNMIPSTTELCCGGLNGACDLVSGSPQCCCSGSCVQPVGFIGSCNQGVSCTADSRGTQCQ